MSFEESNVTDVLQYVLIALSIPLFVAMVIYTIRRARELDRRIDEYHEEEEAAKNKPGPINPYEQMTAFGSEQCTEDGEQKPDPTDPRPGDEQ